MKLKKWTALLIAGMMTVSALAACAAAGTAAPAPAPTAETAEETAPAEEEAAPAEEAAAPAEEAASAEKGDVETIKVLAISMGWGERGKHVIDALNAITGEAIGVDVDWEWAEWGDYGQRVSLAMASNEHFDLINVLLSPATFAYMYSQNQLMDATEYLEEYAPDLWPLLGEYMVTMSTDGKYYGVPTFYNYASHGYILMRKDILDELGLVERFDAIDTWTEMTELFADIHEATGLTLGDTVSYNTIYGSEKISEAEGYDPLKDSYNLIYTDTEGHVSCKLDNPDYRTQQERVRDWYNNGLVYHDLILETTQAADTLVRDGVAFGFIHHSEIGVEVAKEQSTGYPIYAKTTSDIPIYARDGGWVFPITCAEPEAAAKWLNYVYTDPRCQNLLSWGVQDVDYVVTEEGLAKYPEGKGFSDVFHSYDFMWFDCFKALPWDGTSPDYRDICLNQEMKNHPVSPYFGFNMNTSAYDNIMTGISSAYNQYYRTINYGGWTDEDWDNYRAKLDAAGLEELIAGYQEQLDAFMAGK